MRAAAGRAAGLTTRGRCLLAGGAATAACSVLLDERDLLRVGVFAALLPLLALLLARLGRRSVRARRVPDPARLSVGAQLQVAVRLRGSPLLSGLRVTDAVPDAAGPVPGQPPRFTLHRLPGRGDVQLQYPLRPVLRGVHRLGPLSGRAADPLGLAEFDRELLGPDRLVVLPRITRLQGRLPARGTGEGTPGASLAHQGQGASDVLVRPYRYGDEIRRVHWRSTARHDELMVRLEERPWRGSTTVLLDRREAAHRGRGAASSLEFAVELVASACAHLVARGEPVSLVTEDGTALTGPGTVPALDPLLDVLAELRPSTAPDLPSDLGQPEAHSGDVLAVLGDLAPARVAALAARWPTGGCAVLLDVASWEPSGRPGNATAHATAAALRQAGWHAVVATAGTGVAETWARLVAAPVPA